MKPAAAFFLGFVAGFAVGRAGHVLLGGEPGLPHHWMVGIPIIVLGAVFRSMAAIGFGLGLCISDLDDMLALRTDDPSPADLTQPRNWIGTD